MEFLENIRRFCKCRSAHISHTSHIKVTYVCIYIFATYGQFVLVLPNTNVTIGIYQHLPTVYIHLDNSSNE